MATARLPAMTYHKSMTPDYSGEVDDLLQLPAKRRPMGKYIEIAVHPTVDEYGELTDRNGKGLQMKLRPVIDHRHTMTYAGLPVSSERRASAIDGRSQPRRWFLSIND